MPGGTVDQLVLAGLGLTLAVAGYLAVRARPGAAVIGWVVVVALVPFWMGVTVGVYLPPATAVGLVVLLALVGRGQVRLRAPDMVMAAVVVITLIGGVVGLLSVHAVFVVLMDWTLAYAVARILGTLVPLRYIYGVVAVVMAVAALLALAEYATSTNLFVQIPSDNALKGRWAGLQVRGGMLRAEGAFGHSIALGASLALAVPLALGSRFRPVVKVVLVALLLAASVVTFSRIGIGSAVLGLTLSILVLREMRTGLRLVLVGALAAAAVLALPFLDRVFHSAGDEATNSAAYRADLLSLVPSMRVLGTAASAERSADGVLRYGGFRSIDSAVIYGGLTYGWLITGLLCVLLVVAVVGVVGRGATPPGVAVAAQLPTVLTVAFITQFAAFFWFVAGLAVTAWAAERVTGATRSGAARHAGGDETGRTGPPETVLTSSGAPGVHEGKPA